MPKDRLAWYSAYEEAARTAQYAALACIPLLLIGGALGLVSEPVAFTLGVAIFVGTFLAALVAARPR